MKLLLDQGTPRLTAVWLRQSGWDAVHTGEAGLSTADGHAEFRLFFCQDLR